VWCVFKPRHNTTTVIILYYHLPWQVEKLIYFYEQVQRVLWSYSVKCVIKCVIKPIKTLTGFRQLFPFKQTKNNSIRLSFAAVEWIGKITQVAILVSHANQIQHTKSSTNYRLFNLITHYVWFRNCTTTWIFLPVIAVVSYFFLFFLKPNYALKILSVSAFSVKLDVKLFEPVYTAGSSVKSVTVKLCFALPTTDCYR